MLRAPVRPLRYRNIHLDFHNSEHIPAIGADFDGRDFVQTLAAAHVDSITLFAKCHHGWSYYPTKVGKPHPQLARPDLLGDMAEALAGADIEAPIYISVQWDELTAREHPEWRAMSASNRFQHGFASDASSGQQLSPAWHTICLNHAGFRRYILDQAREVATRYKPPGLFFDIVLTPDCVCEACLSRMQASGLDPESPADRLRNDEAVNDAFRTEISAALFAEFPGLRVFYNCGHIHKQGPERFRAYTHLELESLPTGGWGYDHFPSSARYAAALGFDFMGHTGKFHTSWGEFGGFKQQQALDYECAQMVALGSKCLVGDQLHPSGAINRDTYASIAPAYQRVKRLEPFLRGARQVSDIGILSAEHMHPAGARNHPSDDGAAQMLQELQQPFDVIDLGGDFATYRVLILPDVIPVDAVLKSRLRSYLQGGGRIIASWHSGLDAQGRFAIDAGISRGGEPVAARPSYVRMRPGLDAGLPESPFVFYDEAESIVAAGAAVLGEIHASYFNRSYKAFSSHQHAPDDPGKASVGAAVTEHRGVAYVAYPIFRLYRAVGQPLYKYVVRALLRRLMPDPALVTDLPSAGRATLTRQAAQHRHILHLLYAAPQVRGKDLRGEDGSSRLLEMIEDVPAIGPVAVKLRLPRRPSRVHDALTGADVPWSCGSDGTIDLTLPRLHIHAALAFEDT